jgi:hypothetical protein
MGFIDDVFRQSRLAGEDRRFNAPPLFAPAVLCIVPRCEERVSVPSLESRLPSPPSETKMARNNLRAAVESRRRFQGKIRGVHEAVETCVADEKSGRAEGR